MTTSSIGQIITRQDVINAVKSLLTDTPGDSPNWLELYLREIESQKGILVPMPRPVSPESVYGAIDTDSYQGDTFPAIMLVVEPVEDAILHGNGDYAQWYELQIAAVVEGDDEPSAQALADYYGAAIMATIAQNGDLNGFSERTRMMMAPKTEFVESDMRVWAKSTCTFRTLIQAVVNQYNGPADPTPIPPLGPYEVNQVDVTITAYPMDAPIPD